MAEKGKFWQRASASALGTLVVLGAFGLGGAFHQDTSDLATKAQVKVLNDDVATLTTGLADVQSSTDDVKAQVLKDDLWEGAAEGLALIELEDRDYKDLKKWIVDEYSSDFLSSDDYKDVEEFKVVIKDKDVTSADSDDQDATVELELKVYYEDKDGERVKRSILATAELEDGEVEDLEFTKLH